MIYTNLNSPLGEMTALADNGALTGLWFVGQKYYPTDKDSWIYEPGNMIFTKLNRWLDGYFSGKTDILPLELAPNGTPFQKAVWDTLLQIPFGRVTTYGEIANKLSGSKGYSQAVGTAVGHNPISIIIPCHRVIGASGSLTGYAGGLERKKSLLHIERADLTHAIEFVK